MIIKSKYLGLFFLHRHRRKINIAIFDITLLDNSIDGDIAIRFIFDYKVCHFICVDGHF